MICITGDTHGELNKFNKPFFNRGEKVTKDDTVIVLGDFGFIWAQDEGPYAYPDFILDEEERLDFIESKEYTTVFIDGNHENFDRLYRFPTKMWNGGLVHEIRPSILHLIRGEIYTIEGYTFFVMGGGRSHDISDGVYDLSNPEDLSKVIQLREDGRLNYRVKGISWWKQELPSRQEYRNGYKNLGEHDCKVDYILTHSPSSSILSLMGHGFYKKDDLTEFLEDVRTTTDYKMWFFGHMHEDRRINSKDVAVFNKKIRIS